ncbi:MAG: insulinase family protein [Clostridia bacterium]|nr:insulinase family protein [Clostridia bacterium]
MKLLKIYNEVVKETLYYAKHDSGLSVYIMPKASYSKSYAVFGTHFGSVDRKFILPGKTDFMEIPDGVAHFLEHKLFEQPDGGNVFEDYARHGANANAYTSFNLTAYLFESTQDILENLGILLDFVRKPYFTKENVQKEQGIIGQEIGMYDDDPDWRVMMNFLSSMFSEHPVRRDIAGTVETIAQIDHELLYDCYNTFYNLSNMVLFVIGDVKPEEIAECVERHVTENEPLEREIVRDYGNEPTTVLQSEVSQKLSVSVPMFMFGFKDIDTGFDGKALLKKNIELSIIAAVLFGRSGELYSKLYDGGYILGDLGVEVECEKDYGFTVISGESKDPKKVKEIVLDYLETAVERGVSQEDFERVKRSIWGRYIKQFNNINSVAHNFMSDIFNHIGIFDFIDVIDTVTLSDVNKRLSEQFKPEYSVLSVIEPM